MDWRGRRRDDDRSSLPFPRGGVYAVAGSGTSSVEDEVLSTLGEVQRGLDALSAWIDEDERATEDAARLRFPASGDDSLPPAA